MRIRIVGFEPVRRSAWAALAGLWLLALGTPAATAQSALAITEVMSSASSFHGPDAVVPGSDFFEVTNFGPDTNDLAGFQFSDAKNVQDPLLPSSDHLFIRPGESVIFVRQRETTNEAQFRAWWGSCLATDVQIRFYPRPGWSGAGDGIRLYDAAGNLVDSVDFGEARPGVTFVYETNCGDFGVYSAAGACGTGRAEFADDLGSPGTTCGPVPLWISEQPASLDVCAGLTATLRVKACGMPRPNYRWFFNDAVIPGATGASLTITNAHPADAGQYQVEVNNGLTVLRSTNAALTVSANLSPPSIVVPPSDFEVYEGQTARFCVTICAFPLPSFQWSSNGTAIVGATGPCLRIPNCTLSMSGTVFCVQVTNLLGGTNACARLMVAPKPVLRITEIMASACPDCPDHQDWFELTNQGTNAVDLLGYRFSDSYSFEGVRSVTVPASVQPGESVIFAERMTPEVFIRWWGAENLPPGLKIIPYAGFGFNHLLGDELYVWNAAAEELGDAIDSVSLAGAWPGISLHFDDQECWLGCDSVAGQDGAFRAEECGDIGSPGYTANPPPRWVRIARDESGVTLQWHAVEGQTYLVQYKTNLNDLAWTSLSTHAATSFTPAVRDATTGTNLQRFYRVEELP